MRSNVAAAAIFYGRARRGGTTGLPKGVLWRQADIFFAALGGRVPGGDAVASVDELVGRVPYGEMLRLLPAAPFMHNAGHWAAFMAGR